VIGTAMTAGCFNHDGGLCGRPSSRERMKCHEAIPCVSTRDTTSSSPQKSVKQALALAKDPKHPDQTFLGPRSYIRGQTRDRMPRQGIDEITRHGSNGFLVGLENQRELVLAPPSRYTMNPGPHSRSRPAQHHSREIYVRPAGRKSGSHLPGFNGYDVTACATMGAKSFQQISHYSPQQWSNHIARMVEAAGSARGPSHMRPPKKTGSRSSPE